MSFMKKKIIILIVIFIVIGLGLIIVNVVKNDSKDLDYVKDRNKIDFNNLANVNVEDDKKVNVSKEINKEHSVDYEYEYIDGKKLEGKLVFDNVSLYSDKEKTYFKFTFNNNNDFQIDYITINIAFKDDDGNYLYSNERSLSNVEANSEVELEIDDYVDYSNAKTIEILAS